MTGFIPGLLDRLMDERSEQGRAAQGLNLEQIKDHVARDLEALLNTRAAIPSGAFDGYPRARASILNYGLVDFAAFCLTSDEDRAAICASLKTAIETHEPRLKDVAARIEAVAGSVNRLNFVIHARLDLEGAGETVDFSAVLQPSSLRYAIRKGKR
ncbi:type VI secretion system baseplate subunit TssE [Massilia sp. Dwa41.01b]|uniref:type VI secretion system baseplate subunit TssE n=1 Tax=unclassified Massilia TaxID=2609279 RepID=UPI001601E6AC|nr:MULTISPECIES: type VI secretion system baseplate subunit TssE [unclassified Massilia]QNA88758.1 type VI secretion system baseplate subunit TssE [Massilia sp. Dwa41.01b]QNA99661.1 type VI secretion system baseplate subunit TssE [Massilia sp. Se16.2.3]